MRLLVLVPAACILLAGCSALPAPRPLGADEVLVCLPGSFVARRLKAPPGWDPSAQHGKRRLCGYG